MAKSLFAPWFVRQRGRNSLLSICRPEHSQAEPAEGAYRPDDPGQVFDQDAFRGLR